MSTELAPVPSEPVSVPAVSEDPRARQIALLEKIIEQQAALLAAAELQNKILNQGTLKTRVADFGMPFFSMVGLFIEVAIAAIPAAIFVGAAWFIFVLFFGGILRALN